MILFVAILLGGSGTLQETKALPEEAKLDALALSLNSKDPAAVFPAAFSGDAQDAKKRPLPDAAARKKAEKDIREIFKKEFARRKAEDRKALAKVLFQQAEEQPDEPAVQYALFHNAQDLYARAGDWTSAWTVIGEMAAIFAVDRLLLKDGAEVRDDQED